MEIHKMFRIGNNFNLIPKVIDDMIEPLKTRCNSDEIRQIQLGISEIVINAIEHGNLSIGYDQKTHLFGDQLNSLIKERMRQEPYKSRKVAIEYHLKDETVTINVTDGGDGFQWQKYFEPTEIEDVLLSHGRGLLMARFCMDEIILNDKGNRVTMVKHIKRSEE